MAKTSLVKKRGASGTKGTGSQSAKSLSKRKAARGGGRKAARSRQLGSPSHAGIAASGDSPVTKEELAGDSSVKKEELVVEEFSIKLEFPSAESSTSETAKTGIEPAQRFTTRLQLLWSYLTSIGSVAHATSFANAAVLMSLLGELTHRVGGDSQRGPLCNAHVHLQACDPQGNSKTLDVTVPVHDEKVLRAIRDHVKYHDAAVRILHESALQQVVNSFEFLLASIVRQHIRENLKAVSAEHSITYRELLEYGSLEEAQRRVTEAQVLEFLRNKDAAEQLKYLKDSVKVDIRNHFADVDRFLELVLRRHAVVHADGIATAEYRRKAKKLMTAEELPTEGTRLSLDSTYITGSWDCVYSMGIITCHLWARSRALDRKDKTAEEAADNHLNNAAFWALQNQRWAAAQAILGYASKLKLASEGAQRMVAVNLAQAFKWAGDQEACDEVLNRHDWGSSSSVFQATVEALRDGSRLEELLARAIRDGDINAEDVNTWPVFRHVREVQVFLR